MKKFIILVILMFISLDFLFSNNAHTLKELINPTRIHVDQSRIYISDGTSIYIYSLKNFALINMFGGKGEGPGEFKSYVGRMVVLKNKLVINSQGRISFFSKDGKFINSERTISGIANFNYFPLHSGYVGLSLSFIGSDSFLIVSVYDKTFSNQKNLLKLPQSEKNKMHLFNPQLAVNSYFVYENKIYLLGNNRSEIDTFNSKGEKISSFKHGFNKIKFNNEDKIMLFNAMKKQTVLLKKKLIDIVHIPQYFPVIHRFHISEGIIYILGRKRESGKIKNVLRCFNLRGKFILESYMNLGKQPGEEKILYTVNKWILYTLKENKNERWELHINPLK